MAACIGLRLVCLVCKPLWFDEAFSVEVARLDWPYFLHLLWWREANMSLYYLLLRVWLHLGHSPYFIRSLSVIIAAATLPAIYWLARLLFDHRVALISAALFTFNAYDVRYSQEARSYSLLVLLATLSSGLLVWWLGEPLRRNLRGYIGAGVLAVYAHLYALLLIVAHWLVLRLTCPPQIAIGTPALRMRRAWWTIGVLVLPLLLFVAKTGAGPIRWITRPSLQSLAEFFQHLCGSNEWPLPALYVVACTIAVASAGKRLGRRGPDRDVWRLQLPDMATVPGRFHCPAFFCQTRLSRPLHDLLPASPGDTGSRRVGALAICMDAGGDSRRHALFVSAGGVLLYVMTSIKSGMPLLQPALSSSMILGQKMASYFTSPRRVFLTSLRVQSVRENTAARSSRPNSAP